MTFFKHSKLDILPVIQTVFHLSMLVASIYYFDSLPVIVIALAFFLHVHLICANYQSVGHQFLHNPFFVNDNLNAAYSIINSASLGLPSELYRMHHLNHHKGNNDLRDDRGETVDYSSFYRFSDGDKIEGVLSYSIKSLFRIGMGVHYKNIKSKVLVNTEVVFLIAFNLLMAVINLKAFVLFCVVGLCFGIIVSYAHNYAEHYGGDPTSRGKNSVSCYGKVYNFFFYNNGYHQEHHRYPGVHWTKIRLYRDKLPSERERKVCHYSHLHNLFDRFSNNPNYSKKQIETR